MDGASDTVLVAQRATSTVLGALSSLALLGAGVRGDQWALAWAAYGFVGALILWHRPGNRIGWLCVVVGVSIAVSDLTQHLVDPPRTQTDVLVLQLANACGVFAFVGVVLLAAVFPTGRPSGRSGRLAVLIAGVMAVAAPLSILVDAAPQGKAHLAGPLAVPALAPVTGPVVDQGYLVVPVLLALTAVDVFGRWRRSAGVERQQLRWFLAALPVVLVTFLVAFLLDSAGDVPPGPIGIVLVLASCTLPGAVAVAVTRYRLYELDRIVSRTVSYAVVTALVLAVYALVVASASALLPEGVPSWVVAAATLAAAALVRPLLSRVQRVVDRRFNRERVDAQREINAFGQGRVDESDPTRARTRLVEVTTSVFAPSSTALWISEPT